MSYKREQFIENLDDILQDIKEIFILDRGGSWQIERICETSSLRLMDRWLLIKER